MWAGRDKMCERQRVAGLNDEEAEGGRHHCSVDKDSSHHFNPFYFQPGHRLSQGAA